MVDFLLIFHFAKFIGCVVRVKPNDVLVVEFSVFNSFNFAIAFGICFTFFAVWLYGADFKVKGMFKTDFLQDWLHSVVQVDKHFALWFGFGIECSK